MCQKTGYYLVVVLVFFSVIFTNAQTMDKMWDNTSSGKSNPNVQWFRDAKFGLFIHWGLYSKLAGEWDAKRYYGSGEWIMHQAKIPAPEYAKVAQKFNPIKFDAEKWSQLAKDAGIKYMVITAKHHEGFSMFDSKVTDFDIVDASPYKKDPMKALALANTKRGIPFGFYYSQFQDWHETNGGGNSWDFDESKKDYKQYYKDKAVPQLKELLTNYGPLGLIWFDTPGGMTKNETQKFVEELRRLQPKTLFSSRVGQGQGDYRDFGDSEVPSVPIKEPWEAIFTHNDSWGFIKHDMNFKTSAEIIRLLANVASKGGNLMLNIGPDGDGNIPAYSEKFLRETGNWLQHNGESIYASTYGLIPAQPWGVSTSKAGKQYLHVLTRPFNGKLFVPNFEAKITKVYSLIGREKLNWQKEANGVLIDLPQFRKDVADEVFVLEYSGDLKEYNLSTPYTVSAQFKENIIEAIFARPQGNTKINTLTYSHYFGDWKHTTCVTDIKDSTDLVDFSIYVHEPGTYKVSLEYACGQKSAGQEGSLIVNNQNFNFRTLRSSEFNNSAPLLFIKHSIAVTSFEKRGNYSMKIRPLQNGSELFKLKAIIVEPAN